MTGTPRTSNLREKAAVLKRQYRTANRPSLIAIQSGAGNRPPLFCVHPMGGRIHWYYELASYLGKDQPVYGLQARGLEDLQPPHCDIGAMAAHYVAEIKSNFSHGPYFLVGYSFGGMVAFEMARQLNHDSENVALLALLDTHGPSYSKRLESAKLVAAPKETFPQRVHRHLIRYSQLSPREQICYLSSRLWNLFKQFAYFNKNKFRKWLSQSALELSKKYGFSLPQIFRDFKSIHRNAHRKYKTVCVRNGYKYSGPAALLRAIDQGNGLQPEGAIGWADFLTGNLTIQDIPGDHATIIAEPNVRILARSLRSCLDQSVRAKLNRTRAKAWYNDEPLRLAR